MDEERLVQLAEKFMALGKEFLQLIRDMELEYEDEDDDSDYEEEEFEA